jgi:hypothetical protein
MLDLLGYLAFGFGGALHRQAAVALRLLVVASLTLS